MILPHENFNRSATGRSCTFPPLLTITSDPRYFLDTGICEIDDVFAARGRFNKLKRLGRTYETANRESNTVSFLDLSDYRLAANVAVGQGAEGFALSPDVLSILPVGRRWQRFRRKRQSE